MKIFILLFYAILLFVGCGDGNIPLTSPDGKAPIVPGIYITSETGQVMGKIGNPIKNNSKDGFYFFI